jgi:hypothetical protein
MSSLVTQTSPSHVQQAPELSQCVNGSESFFCLKTKHLTFKIQHSVCIALLNTDKKQFCNLVA